MTTTKFVNRARMTTDTTGTGSSVNLVVAVPKFFTLAEAGLSNGDVVDYIIEDGDDFEIQHDQTYSSSGPSLSRGTPAQSKVSGSAGTSQISLSGGAQVAIVGLVKSLDVSTFTEKSSPDPDDLLWGHSDADGERRAIPVSSVQARRVGEFFWYFATSAPDYALACDGSAVSRSTYADLWAFAQTSGNLAGSEGAKEAGQFGPGNGSTTFTLPDLRSEFIRGVYSGRTFGTAQGHQLQNHSHLSGIVINDNDAYKEAYGAFGSDSNSGSSGDRVSGDSGSGTKYAAITSGVVNGASVTYLPPISAPGGYAAIPNASAGDETRPRNVALLPCIVF